MIKIKLNQIKINRLPSSVDSTRKDAMGVLTVHSSNRLINFILTSKELLDN